MAILSDTKAQYTPRAKPYRGYHDYQRTIVFSPETTEEDEKAFIEGVRTDNGRIPGPTGMNGLYMWFRADRVADHEYKLFYGYDSGD